MASKLIVMSGLPGAGKSLIAETLASALGAPVFAKDEIEAPLLRSGAVARDQLGPIGYVLLTTLAQRQLSLGQSVILDSVASTAEIRSTWRRLADAFSAEWFVVECICSDEGLHRERLAKRQRSIPGWPELDWSEVERVRGYFEPWTEERLVLDATHPARTNAAAALEYVTKPLDALGRQRRE